MTMLSFRHFLLEVERNDQPPDMYQAADAELNTRGQIGLQVFDWVPFDDGVYRFGQAFRVVDKGDDDSSVVWVKPVTGKERGEDSPQDDPGPLKLNVMKCARKHPQTGEWIQVACPPLKNTKEFPIPRDKWRAMVNKPFQQMGAAGGIAAPGELPGM